MTAVKTRPTVAPSLASPSIDAVQALWATRELSAMIANLGADSPVAMVLRHARQEIVSLTTSSQNAGTVIGPIRVAA